MKILFFSILSFSCLLKAETINCQATRVDGVKVELAINNFEKGTISYIDPVYGLVAYQGFEKDLLRRSLGPNIFYVLESDVQKKILSFPDGTEGSSVRGILISQNLEMSCNVTGDLAPEVPLVSATLCSNKDYKNLLFESIESGNFSGIKEAVNCGASPNAKNEKGCTALTYGADLDCGKYSPQKITGDQNGKWSKGAQSPGNKNRVSGALSDLLELFASHGALFDAKDPENGEGPLIKLVRNTGDSALVASFLQNDPDVDAQDLEGNTALMWAITLSTTGSEAYGVIRELTAANANRNLKNKSDQTAYQLAKVLGVDEKKHDFLHPFDRRILKELTPSSKTVLMTGSKGSCSPAEINLTVGDVVEFKLVAEDKMYRFQSSSLGIDVMAMSGETKSQVVSLNHTGNFNFVCGVHGANQQTNGFITVK